MLPIVNVIEAASVLVKEFFSVRVETKPSAPERVFPIPLVRELAKLSEEKMF